MSTLNRDCCCNYEDWHRGDLIRCKHSAMVYRDVHQRKCTECISADNPRWEAKGAIGFVLAHGQRCDECLNDDSYMCKYQTQVLMRCGIVYVDDCDLVKVDD